MANTWQGEFPWQNLLLDGYVRTSPVGSFPAERVRPVRHGRQRVGVDERLLRATARHGRSRRASVLCSAQSACPVAGQQLRSVRPAVGSHSAPSHQRWVAPVCAQLLSALPTRGASAPDGRELRCRTSASDVSCDLETLLVTHSLNDQEVRSGVHRNDHRNGHDRWPQRRSDSRPISRSPTGEWAVPGRGGHPPPARLGRVDDRGGPKAGPPRLCGRVAAPLLAEWTVARRGGR